jgi:hypothetical protein
LSALGQNSESKCPQGFAQDEAVVLAPCLSAIWRAAKARRK